MNKEITLSKSNYMLFLKHPAWLWLKIHKKHLLPPIDEGLQALFDSGHEFETYAEKLFPNAKKLGFENYSDYKTLPKKTKHALKKTKTILQGRFEAENLTCIIDVLDRVKGETYDLIEIKSSTKAKPAHNYDLAFQTLVLQKCGLKIRKISIIHVNNEYVKQGDINPEGITSQEEVTKEVEELMSLTKEQIKEARKVINQEKTPDLSPRHVNKIEAPRVSWFQDWLEIYHHLNPDLSTYSIYNLSYPNPEQIAQLEDRGIKLIKNIPEELALRPKQLAQIKTTKTDRRIIDKEKIRDFLETFEYPLHFFDYETFSSLIPDFDELKPYKQYPFQYSLHIQKSPDAPLQHKEYLHNDKSNPMPKLLEKLKKDIRDEGSILVWNESFEKGCNERMAELYPEYDSFLEEINNRMVDLMTPFSKMWFVDKDFFGSASIKYVLPAMVPELSHKNLEVSDGRKAQRIWTKVILKEENPQIKEKILNNLSEYCTLDTFAMVKILEKLRENL